MNNVLSADKKIIYPLTYLGHKVVESKKELGKFYYSIKFNDEDTNDTIEFNFKKELLPDVQALKKYSPCNAILKVSVYNGQVYFQFEGVQK
jgi:hypothetical protein